MRAARRGSEGGAPGLLRVPGEGRGDGGADLEGRAVVVGPGHHLHRRRDALGGAARRHAEDRAAARDVERHRERGLQVVVEGDAVDHEGLVQVVLAGEERRGARGGADERVEAFEHVGQAVVDPRLDLEAGVVARFLGGLQAALHEVAGVPGEALLPVRRDLFGDGPAEDRAVVRPGRAHDLGTAPGQFHLLDHGPGTGEGAGGVPGGGGHDRLDRVVAEGEADGHAEAGERPGVRGDGRRGGQRHRVPRVLPGDHVGEQRAVGDGARHRPVLVPVVQVDRGQARHPAVRRLVADDPVERGRDADRAADVGAGGERCQAGRESRPGAARRAAGGAGRVPRVAGDAPQVAVGEAGGAELGRGGAGVHDAAGGDDALDDRVRDAGDVVAQQQGAFAQRVPGDGLPLLHRDGQPFQRPGRAAHVAVGGLRGLLQRLVEPAFGEGVDTRLGLLGALDQRRQQVDGGQVERGEPRQGVVRRQIHQIIHRASFRSCTSARPRTART